MLKVSLLLSVMVLLGACNDVQKGQHVEVYTIETLEQNDEGIWEKDGYKKVNVINSSEESDKQIKTDIKAIEDYYDLKGNYIRTEVIYSYYNKSLVTLYEEGDERKKELSEPSTILIPDDNLEHFSLDDLTKEEKKRVKEHILSYMDLFE